MTIRVCANWPGSAKDEIVYDNVPTMNDATLYLDRLLADPEVTNALIEVIK